MNKTVSKLALFLGSAVLCIATAFSTDSVTAKANVPPEAELEGAQAEALPPQPAEPVDKNGTAQGNGTGDPLTPDGNGTEVDSVDDNGKYFYTFVTEAGNYFYVVVDETRQDKNVYVLSTVDEEELLTLCKKEGAGDSTMPTSSADETKGSTDLFGTPGGSAPTSGTDTNGDGNPDGWDTNGDGITDAWDTNGDGKPDSFDTNGDGEADICIIGPGVTGLDTNGNGTIDAWDTNGDGIVDAYDSNGDGIPDKFGAEAAQAVPGTKSIEATASVHKKTGILSLLMDNIGNIALILLILGVIGVWAYNKFYKPKYGSIGSGSLVEFEDDPDYRDEDEEYAEDEEYESYPEETGYVAATNQKGNASGGESLEKEAAEAPIEEATEEDAKDNNNEEDANKDEAQRLADDIRQDIARQNEQAKAEIIQQSEKIRHLEEENTNLKEKVTRTTGILTGSVVPEEEEDDEDPEEDLNYEERASPEI